MWMTLVQTAFYLSAGLALFGAVAWYLGSLRVAIAGGGDLVIVPFTIADSRDEKDGARGAALAKMLQARLQEFEHDLASAQEQLMHPPARPMPVIAQPGGEPAPSLTSVVPMLFAAQGAALQTRLFEAAQVKIAVGGVEVGGLIPWIQRLLVNRRTLEFTYYEREAGVVVSGGLEALGLPGEALRVDVAKRDGKPADLDEVASTIAAEIVRRRLSAEPSNRIEALNTAEFRELSVVLNEAARLNRQVALGRLVRDRFGDLVKRIEPLAMEVRDWYPLQALGASLAGSAGDPEKEAAFLTNARHAMESQIKDADRRTKANLEQQIAEIDGRLAALQPKTTAAALGGEQDALTKLADDVRRANEAFNRLLEHDLKPLPVELLPPYEGNAYTDLKKYYAPPAVAQLPEISWHNMSWPHLRQIAPAFYASSSNEANAVFYSYSDVLPVVIRHLGLVESPDPQSWDVYAGAVAWIEASIQRREFTLGDDKRPLRSLRNPGSSYNDKILGRDLQIAHYKDFNPTLEVHAAAGLGGKTFYEAAQRVGVKRAFEVWIAALKQAGKDKSLTYRGWAANLLDVAGPDQKAILEALKVVGLEPGPEKKTTAAPRKNRRGTVTTADAL